MPELRQFASELKFVIAAAVADEVRAWARARIPADPHGSGELGDTYDINTLYFDTNRFDVYHRRASFARSKYRVRRYGETESAFLERKLKACDRVNKRRTLVGLGELDRLTGESPERDWDGYWFHRRLLARKLTPVCQVSYQRVARVAPTPAGTLRLTIDQDLRARRLAGLGFGDTAPAVALTNGACILELKYHEEMPALFSQLITDFPLTPRSHSKYRTAARVLGVTGLIHA